MYDWYWKAGLEFPIPLSSSSSSSSTSLSDYSFEYSDNDNVKPILKEAKKLKWERKKKKAKK